MLETILAAIRSAFETRHDSSEADGPPRTVYGGLRTRGDGLYKQTNTQPGTGLYAADRDAETSSNTATSAERTDPFDCPDPETCGTCRPSAVTAE
ncbi:hypothetical protein [Halorubrum tibetense]|uniref:Uncharacterized protein n=1 Tax=Halorubrum tibetense TaxID=175631 RepID=A0ABD5S8R3_9EURY